MDIVRADVGRHFAKHFNGQKNFMSPTVLGYGRGNNHLEWELSRGSFIGNTIYGVTVLHVEAGNITQPDNLSRSFPTELEATKYIESL